MSANAPHCRCDTSAGKGSAVREGVRVRDITNGEGYVLLAASFTLVGLSMVSLGTGPDAAAVEAGSHDRPRRRAISRTRRVYGWQWHRRAAAQPEREEIAIFPVGCDRLSRAAPSLLDTPAVLL